MNIKMTQGAADAEKRDRAWTRMRRSHLRQAALRVAATKARLAAAMAELAAQEAEGAADAEFHRGQRAYHLAMSLSELLGEEERAGHAVDAAKAMPPARREVLERLRARVRACEGQLELDRRRHAELAAEERQKREFAKALRTLYGAPARGAR